jgi:hypothetical protein
MPPANRPRSHRPDRRRYHRSKPKLILSSLRSTRLLDANQLAGTVGRLTFIDPIGPIVQTVE